MTGLSRSPTVSDEIIGRLRIADDLLGVT